MQYILLLRHDAVCLLTNVLPLRRVFIIIMLPIQDFYTPSNLNSSNLRFLTANADASNRARVLTCFPSGPSLAASSIGEGAFNTDRSHLKANLSFT
jgi:hypothetical protein